MLFKGCRNRKSLTALISLASLVTALAPFSGLSASITLGWDPSTDADVAGYKVYYGAATGSYTNSIQVGNVTTATVSNLVGGVTYYFAASTLNSIGLESVMSAETSYLMPVPVNLPPTLNALGNLTLNEGASAQIVNLSGISSGATNESQTLTVTASSSNTGLIPNPTVSYTSPNSAGTITFTPLPFAFGSATITVTVNDGGASNNIITRTFTVVVNSVNQSPTLNTLANVSVNESAPLQTVNLAGIGSGAANESQTLTVTASSSNIGLIPNPTVNYTSPNATGSISFTPVPLASGSATITVNVSDGGASNNIATRTFTVTVNSVNQAPTLNTLANLSINEGSGLQTVSLTGITTGAANETQTLTVTASSSNTGLIPNPTVSYTSPNNTGSISFTPVSNAGGTATITVTVNDGSATSNTVTRTFTTTVNRLPTITTIANQTIGVDRATSPLAFTIADAETAASGLTVTGASSNTSLVPNNRIALGGTGANRTVTVTPLAGQTGIANITVTLSDGSASAARTFQLDVHPKPAPPSNLQVIAATP